MKGLSAVHNNLNHGAARQKLKYVRRENNRLRRELAERDNIIASYEKSISANESDKVKIYDLVKKQREEHDIFLNLMLDSSPDIFVLMDINFKFITGTKGNLQGFGLDIDSLHDKSVMECMYDVLLPESHDNLFINIKNALQTGELFKYNTELAFKNESADNCTITIVPFKNKNGEVIGVMLQLHDITELQAALYNAEKANRAKSDFLAAMSN
jgi:PAS domain S-box-containing protein